MEDNKKAGEQKEIKNNRSKVIKIGKDPIVILRHRGTLDNTEELEDKYSDKFGCKVVILESNIDYVGNIDG